MTLSARLTFREVCKIQPGIPSPPFFFFLHFFIFLFLLPFYPAHPCGTVNVSQGLPATQTVTKWNGRKNEWKTIKEGPRTGREEGELLRWLKKEGGGRRKNGRSTTYRSDKVHYLLLPCLSILRSIFLLPPFLVLRGFFPRLLLRFRDSFSRSPYTRSTEISLAFIPLSLT